MFMKFDKRTYTSLFLSRICVFQMISPLAIDQNKEIDFLRDGGGSIGSEELGQVVTVQVDLLSDWKKRR